MNSPGESQAAGCWLGLYAGWLGITIDELRRALADGSAERLHRERVARGPARQEGGRR